MRYHTTLVPNITPPHHPNEASAQAGKGANIKAHGTPTTASSPESSAISSTTQHSDARVQQVRPKIRSAKRYLLAIAAVVCFAGFTALGTWQVKRLQWKRELIERVEQRVYAPAVAAPGREHWPAVQARTDEYRRVYAKGVFLYDLTTRVQASTALGSGFWLLTPLRCTDGSIILINRGFISAQSDGFNKQGVVLADKKPRTSSKGDDADSSSPEVIVTGLLRISEPGGAFLRHNAPLANRWYSRDVQAIAKTRNLPLVAPYFIDADQAAASRENGSAQAAYPIGGLTVIRFSNNHLVYALTWYALALMVAAIGIWVARDERRLHHGDDTIDQT